MATSLQYKVLVDGRSCHGGNMTYPQIGEKTPTIDGVRVCLRGYHLTSDPIRWWAPRAHSPGLTSSCYPCADSRRATIPAGRVDAERYAECGEATRRRTA